MSLKKQPKTVIHKETNRFDAPSATVCGLKSYSGLQGAGLWKNVTCPACLSKRGINSKRMAHLTAQRDELLSSCKRLLARMNHFTEKVELCNLSSSDEIAMEEAVKIITSVEKNL